MASNHAGIVEDSDADTVEVPAFFEDVFDFVPVLPVVCFEDLVSVGGLQTLQAV